METNLGRVFDALPAMAWTALPDGHIDFVNRRWFDYTGLGPDEAHGWQWQAVVHPEDLPFLHERWRSILASGEPGEMEARVRRHDGKYRWFAVQSSPMRDDAGQIVKWCGVGTDVDDLRRAAEELQRRELDFQLIVDSIPIPVAVTTPSGEVEGLNRPTLDYFGKSLDELKGWKASEVVHPDDLERTIAAQLDAHQRGTSYNVESRHRRADGVYRWYNVLGMPLRDPQGRILRWLHLLIDIEERKRAEEALRERELSSRLIVDSIPGQVAIFGPSGEVELINRQILDYYGGTPEDLKDWESGGSIHPEDLPRAIELFTQAIATGEPFENETRSRRSDGVYRWFQSRVHPLRDANGRIVRWYGLLIDIDDRKHAESALQESERQLRLIVDTIPGLVAVFGPKGEVEGLNKQFLEYLGQTQEEFADWPANGTVHPDDLARHIATLKRSLETGLPIDFETRLRRFDGVYRWIQIRGDAARDDSGNIVRWYCLMIDVDERKRAEDALAASERNLRVTIDTIPTFAWSARLDGNADFLSRHYLDYLGLSAEQVPEWGWASAVHGDDLSGLAATWQAILSSGEPGEAEARLRRHDGEYRWFLFRVSPLRDDHGNIVKWYGVNTDIEDRKRSEESFRAIVETTPECVKVVARDGTLLRTNSAGAAMAGVLSPDVLVGRSFFDFVVHQHRARYREFHEKVCAGQKGFLEFDIVSVQGVRRHVETHSAPMHHSDGSIVQLGVTRDITERKQAEEELRRSEAFLAQAQRLTQTGSLWWKVATGEIIWSDESYRLMQYARTVKPDVGLILNRVHPEDLALVQATVAEAASKGLGFELEHRLRMPDGAIKHVHVVVQKVDVPSEHAEFVGAITDITARKRVEDELRRSEAFLADAQRLSRTGSFSWRVGAEELTWSEETYRIYELDPSVPVTWDLIRTRVHPDNLANLQEVMAKVRREGGDFDYETRLSMPDQSIKILRVVAHGHHGEDGVLELHGAVQDITERRLADEALGKARSELAHVARISSLGALTASIAHEVNQPLAGIITNASTCMRMLAADPPNIDGARETARRTIRDGNRAADVIARLRALFGKRTATIEAVDLNETAREVIALASGDLYGSKVVLRTEFDDALPPVGADRVQLQQVIMNLLRNAAEAMSDVVDPPRRLLIRTEPDDDEHVRLTVEDAGVGFGPETAERLFEAFYTTKGDGMGIGLSVSRSIVESHNGRLWATPNDGPGATFAFCIPEYSGNGAGPRDIGVVQRPAASSAQNAAGVS